MQYSITLHRTLFVQGWCDVLEQDRTVESSTPYGIGMLSLRNGLLQKSAFLRHNRCIELGKRYIKALASARVKQISPGLSAPCSETSPIQNASISKRPQIRLNAPIYAKMMVKKSPSNVPNLSLVKTAKP